LLGQKILNERYSGCSVTELERNYLFCSESQEEKSPWFAGLLFNNLEISDVLSGSTLMF